MNISIIKITTEGVKALQSISRQTFYETFAESNSEKNMRHYLEDNLSIEKLTSELSNKNSEFYFSTDNNDVIGYLKLNFGASQTELKEEQSVEIERIYVLNAYHGKKVGQLLYDKAIEVAKERKALYVWLGVWEENARAISFYKKNGFMEFDKHIFRLGDDEQTDIMMRLEL